MQKIYNKHSQKGGFLKNINENKNLKKDLEDKFKFFITNSKIYYLAKGSNGLIYKAILNDSIESPYVYLNIDKYNQPIKQIIFKLIFLKNDNNKSKIFNKFYSHSILQRRSKRFIETCTNELFIDEINIQSEIFLKSMNECLQPYCPEILYADIYNQYNYLNFNDQFNFIDKYIKKKYSIEDYKKIFNETDINNINNIHINTFINDLFLHNQINNLGIIAMVFAENYNTLGSYIYNNPVNKNLYNIYVNKCLLLLIELAITTGYNHGDFHIGNLMINPDDTLYYNTDSPGSPLLIDFGYAKKIDKKELIEINELFNKKYYYSILNKLYNMERSNHLKFTNEPSFYSWICGKYNSYHMCNRKVTYNYIINFEKELDSLFQSRESKKIYIKERYSNLIENTQKENITKRIFQGLTI